MPADLLPTVRGFVRDLNLAIKLVALYGPAHKQASIPLETSWKALSAILGTDKKLLITAAGERLLFDGRPLQAGSTDRSMAQLLGSAGIGGLSFLEALTQEEFTKFICIYAGTKAPELCAELKKQLGPKSNVRVMEFRLVGEEGNRVGGGMGASVASQLGASVLGRMPGLEAGTPADILRLLSRLQPGSAAPITAAGATQTRAEVQAGEDEATEAIRWLAHLGGGGGNTHQDRPELTATSANVLRETAASLSQAELESDQPALMALAEKLAIRVALDKYKRGEIPFDAVHQMLERLKKEIENLHKVLEAQQDAMNDAGVKLEDPSEVLERQFWAAIPDRNKLQVLQSEDAWCIPAKNVQSFVEELLAKREVETAERILRHYCRPSNDADAEAQGKLLRGIGEMAEVFSRVGPKLLQWIVGLVGKQLTVELAPEHRPAIAVTFGRLIKQAATAHNYPALANAMEDLQQLQSVSKGFAEQVRAEIQVEALAGELLTEALQDETTPPELVYVLRQMPQATAREIGSRFGSCRQRKKSERLRAVAGEVGAPVMECLRESLKTMGPDEAIPAVGLLTAHDAVSVAEELRKRLPLWKLEDHAAVVHQIACSSAPARGVLLTKLLDKLHLLLAPQALDEIGNSGSAEVDTLKRIANAQGIGASSPFLQLKAVEALGMLRDSSSAPLLNSILMAKSHWSWQHPRELRVVALQALANLDARAARQLLTGCGLTDEDLKLSPLKPKAESWVRSRRYERISLEKVWATVHHESGTCTVSLDNLSLGGGAGMTTSRTRIPAEGDMEITIGLRKLRATVLLHSHASYKVAFEFADMSLDDRAKLRQLLVSKAR